MKTERKLRHNLLFLLAVAVIIPLSGKSQKTPEKYEQQWKQADSLISEGLPKSALKVLDVIYQQAKNDKEHDQVIKAYIYRMRLRNSFEDGAFVRFIYELETDIKQADFPNSAVMHSMLADMYWMYYQSNRWRIHNRTTTQNFDNNDLQTWDLNHIADRVIEHHTAALAQSEKLKRTLPEIYPQTISEGDTLAQHLRPTLFDVLAHKALSFFDNREFMVTHPADKFEIDHDDYFAPAQEFAQKQIQTNDTLSPQFYATQILQQLIEFHLTDTDPSALIDVDLQRLNFMHQHSIDPAKDSLYLAALLEMQEKHASHHFSAMISYEIASFYASRASQYDFTKPATHQYKDFRKKAHQICEKIISSFPETLGAKKCKSLKANIETKSLDFQTEDMQIPNEKFALRISYRNVPKAYVKILSIDRDKLRRISEKHYGDKLFEKLQQKGDKVFSTSVTFQEDNDFNTHTTEILIDPLPVGQYIVMVSNNEKFEHNKNAAGYSFFEVSALSFIERKNADGSYDVYVLNRKTGQPVQGVKAQSWYRDYNSVLRKSVRVDDKLYVTDKNGYFRLEQKERNSRYVYIDFSKGNDFLSTGRSFYLYNRTRHEHTSTRISFFTDRAIYRPGQTVYFKGIVLKKTGMVSEIFPEYQTTVVLYDVNRQKVADMKVTANEYGTFSGSFSLPAGRLNGQMQLYTPIGSEYFSVEEYKRPTFEAKIDDFKGNYRLNDTVKVKGNAKAYSGATLTGAQVKYRVVRQPRWWGWWSYYFNSNPTEIENGTTKTDENGEFQIAFKALPDRSLEKSEYLLFNYQIYVDVTDINGETQSTTRSISIGYKALQVSVPLPGKINIKDLTEIPVKTQNMNGEEVSAKGEIKIYLLKEPQQVKRSRSWHFPDKPVITAQQWETQYPGNLYRNETDVRQLEKGELVFESNFNTGESKKLKAKAKKWQTGRYVAEISSRDAFGQKVENKQFFTLYSLTEKQPPYPTADWLVAQKAKGEPGETAQFLIGSGYENVKVLYEIEHAHEIVSTEWLNLNNEQKLIEIPIEEKHRGNFAVHFIFVKENRIYKHSELVQVPYTNKKLDIEFGTFRDKLYPGQEEEWRITIRSKKGDKVAAEMLATLYDASLDEFRKNSWSLSPFSSYYMSFSWSGSMFSLLHSHFLQKDWNESYPATSISYSHFNWFGFNYYGGGYYAEEGLTRSRRRTGRKMFAVSSAAAEEPMEESAEVDEVVVLSENEREEDKPSAPKKNGRDSTTTPPPPPKEDKPVQIRRNFNETAFFYPHLQTNSEGEVIIKFKVPESLTRWRMLGFAHSREMKYGFVENSLITQKELMVMPNAPRFFRESDKMEFPVKISNVSQEDLSGSISLEFFDGITMKPIEIFENQKTSTEKEFAVKANSNTLATWVIEIPDNVSVITYRVVARANGFSDGEEKPLPVLTNRMLVTESLPLPMRGKGEKEFKFEKLLKSRSSRTLKHHRLTLEYTSNPAWYAVQALPYLIEYPYECTEQTFSRYYANSLASHIANSSPKIKRVFDAWKSDEDSEALLSNLEKNQELKELLLQETPWVLNAQDETQRKQRIAVLFDFNRMANELNSALQKLQQAQAPNGGWPWFPGMPESRYITQHIVTGMGHLDRLGVKNVRQDGKTWAMLKKAIEFIDYEIREEYKYLKKHYKDKELEKNHLSYTAIHYLYGRSFFNDIPVSPQSEKAVDYFKGQARKYWLQQGKYAQGMIALALNREKQAQETPAKIIKSLKEHSTTHQELGMYWKDNTGGYFWYQAPIETQALMIEAFDEVANDQQAVNDLKVWLLKQKQTQDWRTTKATVEAVYALLLRGTDWLAEDQPVKIKLGKQEIDPSKIPEVKTQAGTGYFKMAWHGNEIRPRMGKVEISKQTEGVAWGALYWQYFEQLDKITPHETPLKLKKQLFIERDSEQGKIIEPVSEKAQLKVGDKVIVRIELRVDRVMEYVHMKDMRAAGFEPLNVISRYRYQDGLGYYESTKDASTNFFMERLPKGTFVFEYPLRVTHNGNFSNGITTIQCMYAPEFTSHSEGIRVDVKK